MEGLAEGVARGRGPDTGLSTGPARSYNRSTMRRTPVDPEQRRRLLELARLFTRLGCTAFGGPAAHLAMMEEEVVTRRGWLTRQAFLDLVGATNLIPGPNSTEMAIHVGQALPDEGAGNMKRK